MANEKKAQITHNENRKKGSAKEYFKGVKIETKKWFGLQKKNCWLIPAQLWLHA